MRPGLPPHWQEIADVVRTKTGRELLLRPAAEPFSTEPDSVEVHLDNALLGQFEFWWDDNHPDDAIADLRRGSQRLPR